MTTRLGIVGARDESNWDVETTTDLRAFLTACLDQEEQTVRERRCINCGNRTTIDRRDPGPHTTYTHDRWDPDTQRFSGWEGVRCPGMFTGAEPPQLPERLLAEVAAKRRILARHAPAPHPAPDHPLAGELPTFCAAHVYRHSDGSVAYPVRLADCPDLRDAVAPYAARAGFNPAWRVDG